MRIKRIKNLIYTTSSIMVLGLALLSFDSTPAWLSSRLNRISSSNLTKPPGLTITPEPSSTQTPTPSPTPVPSLAQLNAAVPIQSATDEVGTELTEVMTSYLTSNFKEEEREVKKISDVVCYYKKGISIADYIVYATYTVHYEGSNVPMPTIGEYCISIEEDGTMTVLEEITDYDILEALYLSRASESVSTLYIQETIRRYMNAKLACDDVLLSELVTDSSYINISDISTKTQYIEEYCNLEFLIRSCPDNIIDFDYIVYVVNDVKIVNISTLAPGMDEFMIVLDESNYPKIFFGTTTQDADDFRIKSREQEDFKVLYDNVVERLADAMILDPDLMEFMKRIDSATGSSED